jgi:putative PIG3 family NAD(P)H quinone oxidoreductase
VKAVIVSAPGGPEVLRLEEVPDPVAGPGEVLLEVAAAGVNRADLMQREGHYPPPPGASEVLGLECSGVVAAVGDGVQRWRVGDRCVALLAGGGYATRVSVPEGQLVGVPEGVDLVTAAGLIEVAATVVSNLRLAGLSAGERLLVHGGAGGIGSFAISYARTLGVQVLATAGSAEKLDYCRSLGAEVAISYRDDWVAAVRDATDGTGVDVILDVMGASYLEANVGCLAVGGRLMIIGLQGGRKGTLDVGALLRLRGHVIATNLRGRPVAEKAEICAAVEAEVWPLLGSGAIEPAPQTRFPLADAAAAHRRLESGDNLGKIVLTTDGL